MDVVIYHVSSCLCRSPYGKERRPCVTNIEWARKEEKRMANCRATSKSTASTASKILRDGRYSDAAKSVAGSALSQRADACRKRK